MVFLQIADYLVAVGALIGTAHPFTVGSGRFLILRNDSGFEDIDITDKPNSFFIDGVSLGEVTELLAARIDKHRASLGDMADYRVEPLPSSQITLPFNSEQVFCFVLSVSNEPSYYDVGAGIGGISHVDWSRKFDSQMPAIIHSGDKNHGSDLMQSITLKNLAQDKAFAVFVSGYQGIHYGE